MIRLLIALIAVILFLILTLPYLFILWLIGLKNEEKKYRLSQKTIQWAFRMLLFICGTDLTVYGKENLPTDRAALYVGNHRSIFDILIIYVTVLCPAGLISKKEIKKVPIFRTWMYSIGCIFLDRTNIKEGLKMVLEAVERVKRGLSIIIFPEGTRCKVDGEFLPFKGGSFKIAEKSKCDIIPFAIINSAAIFENTKPRVKKAKVGIVIGEPIKTDGLTREEMKKLPDQTRDTIISLYNSRKEEII